jgi:lysophospholipase L1-like esterase
MNGAKKSKEIEKSYKEDELGRRQKERCMLRSQRVTLHLRAKIRRPALLYRLRNTTRIVCLGDSITAGGYGTPRVTPWPKALAAKVGPSFSVINKGIGGNTTAQMLARVNSDVINITPRYGIVMGGINDVRIGSPSLRGIEDNLSAIYEIIRDAGITLITATVTPPNYVSGGTSECGQEIVDLNAWIVGYSKEHNVENIDFYTLLDDGHKPTYINPALAQPGLGEHPNTAGHAIMAEAAFETLRAIRSTV